MSEAKKSTIFFLDTTPFFIFFLEPGASFLELRSFLGSAVCYCSLHYVDELREGRSAFSFVSVTDFVCY